MQAARLNASQRCVYNWAVSKVLWEWIPNVGSKARESAKPRVLRWYCWIFSIGCQKEGAVYETECTRHVAVRKGKPGPEPFIALKHIQATLYLIHSEMGSQCSFSRRGVEWWWWGAKRTSLAAKFWIFRRGWMTELGVPMRRQLH